MRTPILILLLAFSFQAFSQSKVNESTVFIKGKKGIDSIDYTFFHTDFELATRDTALKVISFRIIWDHRCDSSFCLSEKLFYGSKSLNDSTNISTDSSKAPSLKTISAGSLITFEDIKVEYQGKVRKVPGILVYAISERSAVVK